MNDKQEIVERIREFNRFYTVLIGTLNRHFLDSKYSVTETRILFELITHENCNAKDLIHSLQIDKSYMSRMMKSFEKSGLITKKISHQDHRAYIIQLTDKGQKEVKNLIDRTNLQISDLIAHLNDEQCQEICSAMDLITNYLSRNERMSQDE